MSWSVIQVAEVQHWLTGLQDSADQADRDTFTQIAAAILMLAEEGPALGRPLVDTITASRHRNMKELRPGSAGQTEVRILFAFDPARQAVLLVAGDKSGQWQKWYRRNIPIADDRYDDHLAAMRRKP